MRSRRFSAVIALLVTLAAASGAREAAGDGPGRVQIRSFSGSPPLLEIVIPDPHRTVREVRLESPVSSQSWLIPHETGGRSRRGDEESLTIHTRPVLAPGVYDLDLIIFREPQSADEPDTGAFPDAEDIPDRGGVPGAEGTPGRGAFPDTEGGRRVGSAHHSVPERLRFRLAFVDFAFGRDNLRFGNNSTFESRVGSYSEVLESWLDARFGGVDEADLALLTHVMYGLFGRASGRCYAFSGTAVRYWRWPELLPSYYDQTYDLREASSRTQREMQFLQLDIVFSQFVTGGTPVELGPADDEVLRAELDRIQSRIDDRVPVAAGFTGPDLHHSMVVFGYLEHPSAGTLDLLVANNWKSEEDENLRSRDAEIVRIHGAPARDAGAQRARGEDGIRIEWLHESGIRDREINRIFHVEVPREFPSFAREELEHFVGIQQRAFREAGLAVIVVEEAAGAALVHDEAYTGRLSKRTRTQLEEVAFERVSRTYRFFVPVDTSYELRVEADASSRVLRLAPGPGPGRELAWIDELPEPANDATVTHRYLVRADAPLADAAMLTPRTAP